MSTVFPIFFCFIRRKVFTLSVTYGDSSSATTCPLRLLRSHLSHRERHWRAGQAHAGRAKFDFIENSSALLQRAAASGQYPLSSCCESLRQGTTVYDKTKLCSSRVGLADTPVPLPLGEVSAKQTERARTLAAVVAAAPKGEPCGAPCPLYKYTENPVGKGRSAGKTQKNRFPSCQTGQNALFYSHSLTV